MLLYWINWWLLTFYRIEYKAVKILHQRPKFDTQRAMWQDRDRQSKNGGFRLVFRFPPPSYTTKRQHPRFRKRIYIFCWVFCVIEVKWISLWRKNLLTGNHLRYICMNFKIQLGNTPSTYTYLYRFCRNICDSLLWG